MEGLQRRHKDYERREESLMRIMLAILIAVLILGGCRPRSQYEENKKILDTVERITTLEDTVRADADITRRSLADKED